MRKNIFFIIIIILITAAFAGWWYFGQKSEKAPPIETPPIQDIGNPRTQRAEPRLGKSRHTTTAPLTKFAGCLAGLRFVRQSQSSWTKREQSSYDGNELEKADLIEITDPRPNQEISSPVAISGEACGLWFFEASFPVKIFDANGFLLGIAPAQAQEDWMTENFVPFYLDLRFAAPSTKKGLLVLEKDNPSGLPEHADELRVPIAFNEAKSITEKKMKVKMFLSDSNFANEPDFDCGKTIAVEREIAKSENIAKSSVEALLRGATGEETARGLISNINPGVRIQKLNITNDVAQVDFDNQLEFQIGGSCRVTAIRAQITDTLLQFPEIKKAVISIDGRTDDILQP